MNSYDLKSSAVKLRQFFDEEMVSTTYFSFFSSKFYFDFGRGVGKSILLTVNCKSLFVKSPSAIYVHPGIRKHSKSKFGGKISSISLI